MTHSSGNPDRLSQKTIRCVACRLFFLPVKTRVPLKFGGETLTSVTCARVQLTVECADGRHVDGWGETPLSVQWVWPSQLSYETRHELLKQFCVRLTHAWEGCAHSGHALEIGHAFQQQELQNLLQDFNQDRSGNALPYLAALVCCSPFDLALHDAYGHAVGRPVYETYTHDYMHFDLAHYVTPAEDSDVSFVGKYPADYLVKDPPESLSAWHLVGALDPVDQSELRGDEPHDGYPVLLADWIKRDGLICLKIKLRGTDSNWDFRRFVRVAEIALEQGVQWLSADFNCTVTYPQYVNDILDQLRDQHPNFYDMLLYVEQPFPYELEQHLIDVHSVSSRKPLFMDESAHDWRLVKLGRSLGWNGVALKTCKTQTGALLSLCWAKAHGMLLMVQDLTNPMLAMIPHAQLAANAGTIFGIETNAPQFYPEASLPEARVHPGLYTRREGRVDLSTINCPGFGYRLQEISRSLPPDVASAGRNNSP
jgi:L-alanine-DL-glutamate epimerase-like enolase superfamily enzyme